MNVLVASHCARSGRSVLLNLVPGTDKRWPCSSSTADTMAASDSIPEDPCPPLCPSPPPTQIKGPVSLTGAICSRSSLGPHPCAWMMIVLCVRLSVTNSWDRTPPGGKEIQGSRWLAGWLAPGPQAAWAMVARMQVIPFTDRSPGSHVPPLALLCAVSCPLSPAIV